jgi:2-dehydro-3-deoxygluconokinase
VDVIPAVGNSPNAAVCAARLGLKSALMTNVGDDQYGKDCLARLEEEKVDTAFVKINKGKRTNYHYVLWYEVDRTILIKHEKFNRKWPDTKEASEYQPPSWIYFSSLGEDSLPFHKEIALYLKKHPAVKLAFQPGTFQMRFGTKELKDIYAQTEIFFSNLEEAQRITQKSAGDVWDLAREISLLGPKMVVLSDGPNGAYLYLDGELWQIPIYPNIAPPYERTGAGDAFSATITAALALGLSPLKAFAWGPVNGMAVTQKIGAQAGLLTRKELETYLKKAPADYEPKKIN